MAKIQKTCLHCGETYDICPSCEKVYSKIYYTWRSHYCSYPCALKGMDIEIKGGKIMRVEYDKKRYTLKDYNLEKDEYILPDDTKLKANEISSFIMSNEEFQKVIAFKKPVAKKRKSENTEADE